MILNDLIENNKLNILEFENHNNGTYSCLKLDHNSAKELKQWCIDNNISCMPENELHCTILYSKEPVKKLTILNNKKISVDAKILKWEKLGDALVLIVNSSKIKKFHELMIKNGGTHDYPEFLAHVSVQYDVSSDEKIPDVIPNFSLKFNKIEVSPLD